MAQHNETPAVERRAVVGSIGSEFISDPLDDGHSRLSRRSLLAGAGALLLGPSLTGPPAPASKSGTVVVIGAGMAGISAARALSDTGRSVVVLEARSRVGGRIHTDRSWSGVPIDLGASWIHGARLNPLANLAKEAGATTAITSYDSSQLHVARDLRLNGLVESDTSRWEGVLDDAIEWAGGQHLDVSLERAIAHVTSAERLSATERVDLDFFLNATVTTEWGTDLERLSARSVEAGKEYADSGVDALFPDGYDHIVKHLSKGLRIRTGVIVRRVSSREKSVRLDTSMGRIDAEAVIITVPLGVLKAGSIEFDPVLPAAKRHAISVLEMGVLAKTFLRFERIFWPKGTDWHEYVGQPSGHWTEWVSFAKTGAPVILGFNAGTRGRAVEVMTDREIVADAMTVLREMFGSAIPRPVAMKTTSWSVDPFAFGSYSAYAVGSTRADRVALAEPVGRVFFAGEATEPDYASTVHGARFSGQRAARQVELALR